MFVWILAKTDILKYSNSVYRVMSERRVLCWGEAAVVQKWPEKKVHLSKTYKWRCLTSIWSIGITIRGLNELIFVKTSKSTKIDFFVVVIVCFFACSQCCQLSNFVVKFSNFSDYPSNFFFKKHLATNLAIFKIYLATFDKWLRQ